MLLVLFDTTADEQPQASAMRMMLLMTTTLMMCPCSLRHVGVHCFFSFGWVMSTYSTYDSICSCQHSTGTASTVRPIVTGTKSTRMLVGTVPVRYLGTVPGVAKYVLYGSTVRVPVPVPCRTLPVVRDVALLYVLYVWSTVLVNKSWKQICSAHLLFNQEPVLIIYSINGHNTIPPNKLL